MKKNKNYLKIKLNNKYYLYDTFTNKIIGINKQVYEIIDSISENNILHNKKYEKALDFINTLKKNIKLDYSDINKINFRKLLNNSLPGKLVINLTNNCSLQCRYCNFIAKTRKLKKQNITKTIAIKSLKYYLKLVKKRSLASIVFSGGEPLLNYDVLKESILFIRNQNVYKNKLNIRVITNLLHINEEQIRFFIDNKVVLRVSIDGPEKIHNKNRVTIAERKTYKRIIDNIKRIKKINPQYYEKYIMFHSTIDDIKDVLKAFNFFNTELFRNNTATIGNAYSIDKLKNKDLFEEYKKVYARIIKRYIERLKKNIITEKEFIRYRDYFRYIFGILPMRRIGLLEAVRLNGTCIPGIHSILVNYDGNFYTCEKYCEKGSEIGNYKTGLNFEKIKKLIVDYTKLCKLGCADCWAYRLCSICFRSCKGKNKILDKNIKNLNCEFTKKTLSFSIEKFIYIIEKEKKYNLINHKYSLHNRIKQANKIKNG